jgi:hypothetical protein
MLSFVARSRLISFLSIEDALMGEEADSHEDLTVINCCMRKRLSAEADFQNEKPIIQKVIEDAGHICLFIPKYLCELNPIELYWGYTKQCK